MIEKPVFQKFFHVEIVRSESSVYLLSEKKHHVLHGNIYLSLASFMNGILSCDEIIAELSPAFPDSDIKKILSNLEMKGYITESPGSIPDSFSSFWSLNGVSAMDAQKKIESAVVTVKNLSSVNCDLLNSLLSESGFILSDAGDLYLVLVDDYSQMNLDEFNKEMVSKGKSWVLIKPVGTRIWMGPIFIPGETGCWHCLMQRLEGHQEVEQTLKRICKKTGSTFQVNKAFLPNTIMCAFSLFVMEITRYFALSLKSELIGHVVTFDLMTFQTQKHTLVKRPQCSVCGNKDYIKERNLVPLEIKTRVKKYTEDGGHRVCSPFETFEKYKHLISPITGIVGDVKPIFKTEDGLISVHVGTQISARGSETLSELKSSLRSKGTGKGKSDIQSQVSAMSEAIERYSASYHGDEYTICKSTNELQTLAIPINECLLISDKQYENREEWNRTHSAFHFIPERLDGEKKIEWVPIWSLRDQKHKYIPAAIAYLKYPQKRAPYYFKPISNGLAAGNVLEEAILQGFMEIVERDAVSIWWYNSLSMPGVDYRSFNDPYFLALEKYYDSIGRMIWVLDLTHDFEIPTFVALSRKCNSEFECITFGFGAHFDARIGVSRALTEMNQALYRQEMSGKGINNAPSLANEENSWFNRAKVRNLSYLLPDKLVKQKSCSDYSSNINEDIKADIEKCLEITRNKGLELLVLDLTRPDVLFCVVKVLIPGMRGFQAHFGKGRLYDVPIKLGKLSVSLDENALNNELLTI